MAVAFKVAAFIAEFIGIRLKCCVNGPILRKISCRSISRCFLFSSTFFADAIYKKKGKFLAIKARSLEGGPA